MNGGKPLVTGRDTATAILLQIKKEEANNICRNVLDSEPIYSGLPSRLATKGMSRMSVSR